MHLYFFDFSIAMAKKLYVGNIDWNASQEDLQTLFAEFGDVEDTFIVKDKMSGRSKGFGFVTFTNDADADAAIAGLHGKDFNGRDLIVNEARPPQER